MRFPSGLSQTFGRLKAAVPRLNLPLHRTRSRADLPSLVAEMNACQEALDDFGHDSDHEFTALAQGLGRLNGRLGELRRKTASLDAVLQDRDEDRAVTSAYSLYKDSVDLVHASAGIAVSAHDQLEQVEAALLKSQIDQDAFARDHMYLRFITLSIRIEASRLPAEAQAVFLNVASAIAKTGEQIQRCTETAFAGIQQVIAESQAARADLKATQDSLHAQARQSIGTMQRELDRLRQALAPSIEHSQQIAILFASAQPQVLGVISALQHQDIVRQQLEHVGGGFRDMEEHLRAAVASGSDGAVEWDYLVHAARIQTAQLGSSRDEITRAGDEVVGGLRNLLDTCSRMVEQFSAMDSSAATALDNCRIADLFATELAAINRIVAQSQDANTRTNQLLQRIEEVVRKFSAEISRYELDVKIVALNAQIAAARLSSADALNRLAEETSHLSDASSRITRRLSADLAQSLGRLASVKHDEAGFLELMTREQARIEGETTVVKQKLSRLVQSVRSGAVEARRDFEPLYHDFQHLLNQLRFPSLIEATFTPAGEVCERLVAGCKLTGTAPSASALSKIRQHESRYTMEKEGATHHAILEGAAVATLAAEPGDDGIELFDAPEPALSAPPAETAAQLAEAAPTTAPAGDSPRPAAAPANAAAAPVASDKSFGDGIELF